MLFEPEHACGSEENVERNLSRRWHEPHSPRRRPGLGWGTGCGNGGGGLYWRNFGDKNEVSLYHGSKSSFKMVWWAASTVLRSNQWRGSYHKGLPDCELRWITEHRYSLFSESKESLLWQYFVLSFLRYLKSLPFFYFKFFFGGGGGRLRKEVNGMEQKRL